MWSSSRLSGSTRTERPGSNTRDPDVSVWSAPAVAVPPTSKPAILKTLARSVVRNLRNPDPAHHDVPQRNVSSRQAQWFVLSQVDSATVSTPDGRGVTFRRRDPQLFRRQLKTSG